MTSIKHITLFNQKFTSGESSSILTQLFDEKREPNNLVGALNLYLIVMCKEDDWISKFYNSCDIVNVDGRPLVYVSRILSKYPFPEMVGGPKFWLKVLEHGAKQKKRFYFLGSHLNILSKAKLMLEHRINNINIVGMHHGYFDPTSTELNPVISDICENEPDIIFIGAPSPKKEIIADKLNKKLIDKKIILVGGAFDYFAGEKRIGNELMSKLCLDWTIRIAQEPKRLLLRYLNTGYKFMFLFIKEVLLRKNSSHY